MIVLVSYDIRDNRKRKEVSNLLERFGDRVQKSVFECPVDSHGLQRIIRGVENILKGMDDSVIFYPVCSKCLKGRSETRSSLRLSQRQTVVI